MGRVDDIFRDLRSERRKALMPFLCAGYPTLGDTRDAILACGSAGASVIEIGIPFTDPIADGPVIAGAMHHALAGGVTPGKVFEAVRGVRSHTDAGLVAMVSYSIAYRMGGGGARRFVGDAVEAGFDGFIFPDAPADEQDELVAMADEHGVSMSLLVAPTTSDARLGEVVSRCRGFVYLMARVGITGMGGTGDAGGAGNGLGARVKALRGVTGLPIACGFGISDASQVRDVVRHADAAIVGSALVRRMGEAEDVAGEVRRFVKELASGLS